MRCESFPGVIPGATLAPRALSQALSHLVADGARARFSKVPITFGTGEPFYVRDVCIKDSNFAGFES